MIRRKLGFQAYSPFPKVFQGLLSLFQYFNKLRGNIISSQPQDKQQTMVQCFDNLMEGIERSLLTKNRDRYENIMKEL